MIFVYAIHNRDYKSNKDIDSLIPIISEEKKTRVERFILKEDKNRCILGEVLVRFVLWNYFNYNLCDIKFKYNEYRKPILYDNEDIHFNISHSGDWIVCGISDRPIGIDVEFITKDVDGIAQRFFVEEENTYINKQLPTKQYDAFFKIWTLKESYIKCIGKGLSIPLNTFYFKISEKNISFYKNEKLNCSYLFQSKRISDDYYLGLCTEKRDGKMWDGAINYISVQQLVNWGT